AGLTDLENAFSNGENRFCEKCGAPLIQFPDGHFDCPHSGSHTWPSTEFPHVQSCTYCGSTSSGKYCITCGRKFSDIVTNPFAWIMSKAWRKETEKAQLFVNASGTITNLEIYADEIRRFTDAVPQDYPSRQEVAVRASELENTVSEIRGKVTTEKEVPEIRGIVEDATKLSTQLDKGRRLIVAMTQANHLFVEIVKSDEAKLFREDPNLIVELMTPCDSEQEFGYKLGAFRSLLEVDLKFLKSFSAGEPGEKSVKLLRRWAAAEGNTNLAFDTFQDVLDICGVMAPFHPTRGKIIEICEKHGENYPPSYEQFWASLSGKLLAEVNNLLLFLNDQRRKRNTTA